MAALAAFAALASVLAISAFLVLKCRIPAAFAPLVALCAAPLWLTAFGLAGILTVGTVGWFAAAAAALCAVFLYKRGENDYRRLITPASLFFLFAAVAIIVYLAIRQPLLGEWDEAVFWSPAVKLMKMNGELYTTAEMGWPWPATQTPALPLLAYLFSFCGSFANWVIYAAYDIFMVAIVSALVGNLSFKQYKMAVPLAFIGLLTPWFFTVYQRLVAVDLNWLSGYADVPSGMLFGGVVLLYIGLRRAKAPLWPVGLALAALSLVKDNTFLFSLVAAGIIAVDFVFLGDRPTIQVLPLRRRLKMRLARSRDPRRLPQAGRYPPAERWLRAALFFVCSVLPYLMWNRHIAAVVAAREAAGAVGATSLPLPQVLLLGLQMLFVPALRSEQFSLALTKMWNEFLHGTITMLPKIRIPAGVDAEGVRQYFVIGTGPLLLLLIVAIFVGAALLARHRSVRRRCFVALGVSLLGFVGYYIELIFSYGIIFKYEQAAILDSYNRYVYAYYIGWFLLSLGFFALSARDGRPYGVASGFILALAALMMLRCTMLIQPQYSVLGYSNAAYSDAQAREEMADAIRDAIGDDEGRVFFISQGDNGQLWFQYSDALLPVILDYSGDIGPEDAGGGGGTYGLPVEGEAPGGYHGYTPEEIQEYMQRNSCTYMFIENLDDGFVQAYGELFSDGLQAAIEGETVLYRATGEGADWRLEPVEMEVPAR